MSKLAIFLKRKISDYPDSKISDTDGTIWSYKDFLHMAESFSTQLTSHKYGILCRSGLLSALAIVACVQAGVTAVPISFQYGELYKEKIIKTCGLSHIITDDEGMLEEKIINQNQEELENLEGVAFMMCTSGTTGFPKAAMLTGENILSNLQDIERYFPLSKTDRILISRSLCHAAVLTGEFLISLCKGADVVFDEIGFNPAKTVLRVKEYEITVICGTPTFFYHFSRFALRGQCSLPLNMIVVSGECMAEKTASLICKALPGVLVYHVYGLTEASPRVTCLPPEYFKEKPTSVGNPLASVKIKILNEKESKFFSDCGVSLRKTGELWISGPNIMKGYYNNPFATQKVLQNNWLKTGDIAYLDDDGHLVICGRKDDLIIVGGLNIYPAEIENLLLETEHISEAFVYGRKNEMGLKLVFDIVPSNNSVTIKDIFSICREKLPSQYWPHEIVLVQSLHKSVSGKRKHN